MVAEQLAPHLMGAIAVAAYSYMALVPLIQPPIMRLLTTAQERRIEMTQLREVSRRERILFPLVLLIVVALVLPTAAPPARHVLLRQSHGANAAWWTGSPTRRATR